MYLAESLDDSGDVVDIKIGALEAGVLESKLIVLVSFGAVIGLIGAILGLICAVVGGSG